MRHLLCPSNSPFSSVLQWILTRTATPTDRHPPTPKTRRITSLKHQLEDVDDKVSSLFSAAAAIPQPNVPSGQASKNETKRARRKDGRGGWLSSSLFCPPLAFACVTHAALHTALYKQPANSPPDPPGRIVQTVHRPCSAFQPAHQLLPEQAGLDNSSSDEEAEAEAGEEGGGGKASLDNPLAWMGGTFGMNAG